MEIDPNPSENTIITASGSRQFDYDNIKERFNLQLSKYCSKKENLMSPCSSEEVRYIVKAILDSKTVKHEPGVKTFASRAIEIYDVINQDEKQLLILKNKNEDEQNIVVVPNEDCFVLLAKTHLENNHADQEEMLRIIRKKYFIREENVNLFLDLCNICKPKRQMCQDKSNKAYNVFIMNLLNFQDKPYMYLLVLVEKFTGYFHLRPLVLKNASEVAVELYKIFADYGPPFTVMTPDTELFLAVNSYISKMCPDFSFDVNTIDENEIQKYDELVKNELCEWISMTGCSNWATGCRMVQWKINNIEADGTTPYKSLFGVRPNDSLYLNPVWLRISDVRTEKVLLLVEDFKKTFNLNPFEISQPSELIIEQGSPESGLSSGTTADDDARKCVICYHPVYRCTFCTTCSMPMHAFCGTRFVGRSKTIYHLCLKCRTKKLNV